MDVHTIGVGEVCQSVTAIHLCSGKVRTKGRGGWKIPNKCWTSSMDDIGVWPISSITVHIGLLSNFITLGLYKTLPHILCEMSTSKRIGTLHMTPGNNWRWKMSGVWTNQAFPDWTILRTKIVVAECLCQWLWKH